MKRIRQIGAAERGTEVPVDHSMSVLASIFGYSRSELDVSLQEDGLVWYRTSPGHLLLQLASVDVEQAIGRVQLWGRGDVDDLLKGLKSLEGQYRLDRLCSYVFPWEQDEMDTLQAAGFAHEATYRQHVYVRGCLQDLLVFGRVSGAL